MSAVKNWQTSGNKGNTGEILKQGYLKKLKTMKKKYFVLRADSVDGMSPACLEYYDSEKKWKANHAPKRSIVLRTCFNINKRTDIKQKWVIALYTKKDCFCIVLENEEDLEEWLKRLLELQLGEAIPEGEPIKPTFEHVWQVTVLSKELGGRAGILGVYHLCLTDQTLSLVKVGNDDKLDCIEFSLQKIRRCGHVDSFFYMEVGQCTVTGAGSLWMQTEDTNIAENMHLTIDSAWRNCRKKDLQPKSRNRSSSANESSKPISFLQRWPTHTEDRGGQTKASEITGATSSPPFNFQQSAGLTAVRDRCDSLPSRARTTSEGAPHLPHPPRTHLVPSHSRPHSMYTNRGISYSPPVASSPVSPASVACSTDSAGSSLSMDGDGVNVLWDSETGRYCHSLTPDEPVILEENDDYGHWPGCEDEKLNNNVNADRSLSLSIHSSMSLSNTPFRKPSPNPGSGFKSSSPSQGSYMDTPSCGSSPLDTPGGYLLMSPGESRTPLGGKTGSVNHSRGSSLAEDGYVHMAPTATDDGYMDMDRRSNQHGGNKTDRYQSGDNSAGSSCSITSGTPSTDIRFIDYPLEKVITFFPPDEEVVPMERHTRAYSVGSRPNKNSRPEMCPSNDCERTRAFSFGSHFRMVRVPSVRNPPQLSSSHSSVEPSDDLMELDFSKKGKLKNRKKPSSIERLCVPPGSASNLSSAASSYSTANSEGSYMEMSPRASPSLAPSPPKSSISSKLSSVLGKSPPKPTIPESPFSKASPPVSGYPSPSLGRVLETEPGYMEMTPGTKGELLGVSPPSKFHSKSQSDEAYVEMKPGQAEAKQVVARSAKARIESFPMTEPLKAQNPLKTSSPPIKQALMKGGKDDYLDMSLKRKTSVQEDNNNSKVIVGRNQGFENINKATEDYVEMSVNTSKSKGSDSDVSKISENEPNYMNMSMKKERRGSKKDRNRYSSQPITIQSAPKDTTSIFSFGGRKHSTGTPPKIPMYLPLGNPGSPSSSPHPSLAYQTDYSSLTRNKSKKTSTARRDSKDQGNGMVTPTGSNSTIFHFSLNSPTNSPATYESSAKCPVDATSGTVKISYTDNPSSTPSSSGKPQLAKEKEPSDDYVNFQPKRSQEEGDYLSMEPGSDSTRKISAPAFISTAKMRPMEKLLSGLGSSSISAPAIVTVPAMNNASESDTLVSSSDSSRLSEEEINSSKSEVKSDSRTSSVSSVGDKELNYLSLNLKQLPGSEKDESAQSLTSQTESSSASTPSPNVMPEPSSSSTYAEIDFEKSVGCHKTVH